MANQKNQHDFAKSADFSDYLYPFGMFCLRDVSELASPGVS